MNTHEKKLDRYLKKYLCTTEDYISSILGKPEVFQDGNETVCFYKKTSFLVFKDEIGFVMKNGKVSDITITEFFLGIAIRVIYHVSGETPKYKTYKVFSPHWYLKHQ